MKYKLINLKTKEEYLCDKVTIDGFDYYVSDVKVTERFEGYLIDDEGFVRHGMSCEKSIESFNGKKVIATNNPKIDIPKVVNEVDLFSEEDMIDFRNWEDTSDEAAVFWRRNRVSLDMSGSHNKKISENIKSLFEIWKKQRPKTVYYTE